MAQRKSKSEAETKAQLLRNLDKIKNEYQARVKEIRSSSQYPKPAAAPPQGKDKQKLEQKLRRSEEAEKRSSRLKAAKDMREPRPSSKPVAAKPSSRTKPSSRPSIRGGGAASNTSSRKDGKSTLEQLKRLSNAGPDALRISPGMGTRFPGV